MTTDRVPTVGETWDMVPTAEMRRNRVVRAVVIEWIGPAFRGGLAVKVAPAPGQGGRRATLELRPFLRKFTPRD